VHQRFTQKQCTTRGSSWGLPSLSLTTKGFWLYLGGGSPSLSSPTAPEVSKIYDFVVEEINELAGCNTLGRVQPYVSVIVSDCFNM